MSPRTRFEVGGCGGSGAPPAGGPGALAPVRLTQGHLCSLFRNDLRTKSMGNVFSRIGFAPPAEACGADEL